MRHLPVTLVAVASLLAGCDSAESQRIAQVRSQLAGTWSTSFLAEDARVRHHMVLQPDGKFTQRVHITPPDGPDERVELTGEWSYDGSNFKRRYLTENGRKFAGASIRYATFPLVSVSDTELVTQDTINGGQRVYQRERQQAQP